jgi:hypothetical protein
MSLTKGQCKNCSRETEDIYYVFCSIECQSAYYILKEDKMNEHFIDKELYIKWLEDKTKTIDEMTTREEIEARILEIRTIEFYCKYEWAMLHQRWDKIAGRKGIPPWLKEERDKLITDPNIKVDWDAEPRKREKKEKKNLLMDLLGIDLKDLSQELKNKSKPPKEEPIDINETMNLLVNDAPKQEVVKASSEEVADKAAAIKEKMRLAKEARLKSVT